MKKLKLLVSLPTEDNDFQLEQALAAQRTGAKLGIDVSVIYSDNDSVNQSTHILKAIQSPAGSRPDGIVLEPVRGSALPQVALVACDAGMAWAVLNRAPSYISELRRKTKVPVFAVSSSHGEIGRIQGKQFATLLPEGGSVLYIEGPSYSTSAQERTAGMMETKPKNIQITTLKGQWTAESAERAVSSWLRLSTSQKVPVDLVGAQDDSMAMGARAAFEKIKNEEERNRWLGLPFTGCDGVPKTGQKWLRDGLLAATIFIPPLAGKAVDILANAMSTGKQPLEHTLTASTSLPPLNELRPRRW
jgi:ABC-type sugar transport system substrate-binding protein